MNEYNLTNEQKEHLAYLETRLFASTGKENFEQVLTEIIRAIPNNYDLGTYLRSLFNQLEIQK